ncbi:hypothetical protein [Priestia sp. YIM B13486]|uniref:hypothetical protein n=1 Tax=Priestia sp. YIM B13486 TaxID=3366304 RepID=UPI0036703C48
MEKFIDSNSTITSETQKASVIGVEDTKKTQAIEMKSETGMENTSPGISQGMLNFGYFAQSLPIFGKGLCWVFAAFAILVAIVGVVWFVSKGAIDPNALIMALINALTEIFKK